MIWREWSLKGLGELPVAGRTSKMVADELAIRLKEFGYAEQVLQGVIISGLTFFPRLALLEEPLVTGAGVVPCVSQHVLCDSVCPSELRGLARLGASVDFNGWTDNLRFFRSCLCPR